MSVMRRGGLRRLVMAGNYRVNSRMTSYLYILLATTII